LWTPHPRSSRSYTARPWRRPRKKPDRSSGFVEARHGHGWRGVLVTSDDEITAAAQLRLLIAETRALRVPAELDDIAALIGEAHAAIDRASAEELHQLRPIDPARDPSARSTYEQEVAVWNAEIAEAARREHRS
jgi:hypothetical protein